MDLASLVPKSVDFKACSLDLTFRPFTLADDIKAQEICGGIPQLMKAFDNFDFDKLSLIAWYQLEFESQSKVIESVTGKFRDPENGEEKEANLKPIEKFRSLFLGVGGQISLITDLIKCKGLNIPDLSDEIELKKWVDQMQKEILSSGLKSST